MKLLLVTFFLRNEQKNYESFFVTLRGNVLQWWHFIPQSCVVVTQHNVNELTQRLLPHIDATTDYFIIVEIKPHEFQGWLPPPAWEWLGQVSDVLEPKKPALRDLPSAPKRLGS